METVIALTGLLLVVFFIFQTAVWWHASHVAQAAAQRALDAGSAYQGSAAAGQAAGTDTLNALASGVLDNPTVTVTRTATDVHVQVTGVAESVVPGIHWAVHASAAGKVERFVPATQP